MKNYMKLGLIYIVIGAFLVYWAMTHSPNDGMGEIIKRGIVGDSYTMSSNAYYITLFVGAVAAVIGVWKIISKK
ncbi:MULTISPECIES: hypothetical protein [Reichenbachiella]|uniref:Uncharacterized protein n=1 Tax=Reichenbachiella agariperforans TaxID=156994 RepID=A0A1M6LPA8_REIAG|nr:MULTISPECIES: hypothetical protein [Reichenbachiella]MBU2913998.1 hypothetical protein [Reichenbachiella agariperforans]RJE74093.1 hypothetical protein BGP76_12925 [Reichenbachiella sp. MSK19-1]SHJ72902.1 hypothetical protein SAMN04488028_1011040 [Reichenbachiella agariperforans]